VWVTLLVTQNNNILGFQQTRETHAEIQATIHYFHGLAAIHPQYKRVLQKQLLSIMWSIIIDAGACWDNPIRVYGWMASVVVFPYVLHINRAAHARNLVDVLGVIEQIRVFPDEFLVALEVNSINLENKFHES
jgi:hypothetical protein